MRQPVLYHQSSVSVDLAIVERLFETHRAQPGGLMPLLDLLAHGQSAIAS